MHCLLALIFADTRTTAHTQYWCTHPLHNVMPDTPSTDARAVEVSATRGQLAEAQIVLRRDTPFLIESVQSSPLTRNVTSSRITSDAFAYYFVEYHRININSAQTPPTELLAKAPADFPD